MAKTNFSKDKISCIQEVQKSPDSDQESVFKRFCARIKDEVRIGILALVLGLSPNALANDTQDKNLQEISQMHIKAVQSGELSSDFPLTIAKIDPKNALEELVTGGSKLPKKTWQELVNGSEDFGVWIDVLFDTSDIDSWLRMGPEKRLPTEEEKKSYKEEMVKVKEKWGKVISNWQNEIQKGELDKKVFTETDALFEEGKKSIIFPSRETFRRLLVASASIAYNNNYNGNQYRSKKNIVSTTATQTGEYTLLTNPEFSGTKIEFGNKIYSVKYILPDSQTISSNPSLKGLENISTEAIRFFKNSFKYNIQTAQLKRETAQSKQEIARSEGRIARSEGRIARSKQEIARSEGRIARSKQEIARSEGRIARSEGRISRSERDSVKVKREIAQQEEYIKISTKLDNLTHEILGLISNYINTKDSKIYDQIQDKMKTVNSYLPIIHTNNKNGNIIKDAWKKEIVYIRNLQAKVNQLPKIH